MPNLSPVIVAFLISFANLFSRPVWKNSLTLVVGAILCRGKRTVCAALRVMGLGNHDGFAKYHHVLNRVDWSPLTASKILLTLILNAIGHLNPLWNVKQVRRWLRHAAIILVGDGGFASGKLAWEFIRLKISLITRLKMNARLYAVPPPEKPGKRGRKKCKGEKLITFREMILLPAAA